MGIVDFANIKEDIKKAMIFYIDEKVAQYESLYPTRAVYYKISIEKDFTDAPGADTKENGPFSGEEFFEKCIIPAIKEYNQPGAYDCILIDLDGVYGIPHLFIRGAVEAYEKHKDELEGFCIPNIVINNSEETASWDDIKDYLGGVSFHYATYIVV